MAIEKIVKDVAGDTVPTVSVGTLDPLEISAAAVDTAIEQENNPVVETKPANSQGEVKPESLNAKYFTMLREAIGGLVVAAGSMYDPLIMQFYTPDAVKNIAQKMVDLADAYQLDLGKWLGQDGGKLGAWMGLAMAVGMPIVGYLAHKAMLAQGAPAKEGADTAPGTLAATPA